MAWAGSAWIPGVSLRCAPGRASRAVGNETTVANGAESPPRPGDDADRRTLRGRAGASALRARIPHATREDTGTDFVQGVSFGGFAGAYSRPLASCRTWRACDPRGRIGVSPGLSNRLNVRSVHAAER